MLYISADIKAASMTAENHYDRTTDLKQIFLYLSYQAVYLFVFSNKIHLKPKRGVVLSTEIQSETNCFLINKLFPHNSAWKRLNVCLTTALPSADSCPV